MKTKQLKIVQQATIGFLNRIAESTKITEKQGGTIRGMKKRFEALIENQTSENLVNVLTYLMKAREATAENNDFNKVLCATHIYLLTTFRESPTFKSLLEQAALSASEQLKRASQQRSPQQAKTPNSKAAQQKSQKAMIDWTAEQTARNTALNLVVNTLNPSQLEVSDKTIAEIIKTLIQKANNIRQGKIFEDSAEPLEIVEALTVPVEQLTEMQELLANFLTTNKASPRIITTFNTLFTTLITAQTPDNWNAISSFLAKAAVGNKNLTVVHNIYQGKIQEFLDHKESPKKRGRSSSIAESEPALKRAALDKKNSANPITDTSSTLFKRGVTLRPSNKASAKAAL